MELKNYNVYFFFAVLTAASILVYFIFKPFLVAFLVAAVLAHLFGPVYSRLLKLTGKRRGLSSTLVCILVALIIIVPLYVVFSLVFNESRQLLTYFSGNNNHLGNMISDGVNNLSKVFVFESFDLRNIIDQKEILGSLQSLTKNTLGILQGAYQSISHFVFSLFIMFFSLFYLLIDGKKLTSFVMKISPLKDRHEKIIIEKFNGIIKGTVRGNILIAVIQAVLAGILFWSTGVSSPAILGVLAGFASFVPTLGTGIVWLPVGLIMIIIGHPIEGIVILSLGALVISMIDNVVFPRIMKNDMKLHPILILFSTLGGIAFWGVSGIIVGPIAVSFFVVLWEIYSLEFKTQLREFNK